MNTDNLRWEIEFGRHVKIPKMKPKTETTPFHRFLIKQRQWCEKCSDLTPAVVVRNYNGRDTVLCNSHAGRLDAARISERKQNESNGVPTAVKLALRTILNHVEPGWDNCKTVIRAWLDAQP